MLEELNKYQGARKTLLDAFGYHDRGGEILDDRHMYWGEREGTVFLSEIRGELMAKSVRDRTENERLVYKDYTLIDDLNAIIILDSAKEVT